MILYKVSLSIYIDLLWFFCVLKLPIKCFNLLDGLLFLYTVPVLGFILSIFGYLADFNYKFNVYAYFTKLPYNAFFIFFIICTIYLIRYIIKRKIRIAVIHIVKKYIVEGGEGDDYYLMDINKNIYHICRKIYDSLEGNEEIEVVLEDDDDILQLLNIRK